MGHLKELSMARNDAGLCCCCGGSGDLIEIPFGLACAACEAEYAQDLAKWMSAEAEREQEAAEQRAYNVRGW